MASEQTDTPRHELRAVLEQFPELSPTNPTDEQTLKMLQAKYSILLQITDQSLRDRELRIKEGTGKLDRWTNPLVLGVFTGALGLLGTFFNGLMSNRNEGVKLQNELIKEAIKPPTVKERANSLLFFAKNGLIELSKGSIESLVAIAGTDQPVPASSTETPVITEPQVARALTFNQAVVDRIRMSPGVVYPASAPHTTHVGDTTRRAIILHDAGGGKDSVLVAFLRKGRGTPDDMFYLPGPLAHWAVQSDGTVTFIADETSKANHVGRADRGLSNKNTIGIEVTGMAAFQNERQLEALVRLVADVADRWTIPTPLILSHAEVAVPHGRKSDMFQQAPAIRQMVDAVRKKK